MATQKRSHLNLFLNLKIDLNFGTSPIFDVQERPHSCNLCQKSLTFPFLAAGTAPLLQPLPEVLLQGQYAHHTSAEPHQVWLFLLKKKELNSIHLQTNLVGILFCLIILSILEYTRSSEECVPVQKNVDRIFLVN